MCIDMPSTNKLPTTGYMVHDINSFTNRACCLLQVKHISFTYSRQEFQEHKEASMTIDVRPDSSHHRITLHDTVENDSSGFAFENTGAARDSPDGKGVSSYNSLAGNVRQVHVENGAS